MMHFLKIVLDESAQGNTDGYYYNNPEAAGAQLYPTGLHKYYDMYSDEGFWAFIWQWLLYYLEIYFIGFTLGVPFTMWMAIFDSTLSWDDFIWIWLYPIKY